jgi:hypothetical protein
VSGSLYQAAKIAAAAAPLVEPAGTLLIVADCCEGIGPLEVVNDDIFRIGVLPRRAEDARVALVSSCAPEAVGRTLIGYERSVDVVLSRTSGARALVLPRASQEIVEGTS